MVDQPRRQFKLPEPDERHLDGLGLLWEALVDGGNRWILIHERPVVPGYRQTKTLTALLIPANYPGEGPDMVYFMPALERSDGRGIANLVSQSVDGKSLQGWSRHRTPQNPWREGEDDLASHLMLVDSWLERELRR
jgi:hypothetical protein